MISIVHKYFLSGLVHIDLNRTKLQKWSALQKCASGGNLKPLYPLNAQPNSMKEAVDKDQIPQNQPELCPECKFMIAHPNLQNLCPTCFHKKQRKTPEVKLQEAKSDFHDPPSLLDIVVKQEEIDSYEDSDSESCSIAAEDQEDTKMEQLPPFLRIPSITKRQYNFQEFVMRPSEVKLEEGQSQDEQDEKIHISLKRGYPQIFQVKTDKCNFCSRKTGILGFSCGFCRINFCRLHRIPQNHECSSDFQSKCRKKLRRQLIQNSIQKKHKGKLQQI